MKLKFNRIIKSAALILILSVIISLFSACSGSGSAKYGISSLRVKEAEMSESKYHIYDKSSSIFVLKSGLIELYFDKVSYSVAVKDTSANRVWYSIPVVESENEQASVLSVKLSDKDGNAYIFNSQDNSVAFDSASFNSAKDGISVTYRLANDAKTASKSIKELEKGTPAAEITAEFKLVDGSFYVSIPDDGMKVPEGINLESVTVLDYLSSTLKTDKDDFIFVPDGCGALIKNAASAEKAEYNVPVYKTNETSPASAVVPAFGVKQGDAAYMALVESGDEFCEINASTGSSSFVSGRAGATFNVTEMKYQKNKNGRYTVYSGIRSGDDLCVAYRFLSGKNASYSSFATACREMLIRDSVLSVSGVGQTEYYPIAVSIDCAAALNKNGSKIRTLSTFEETEDIVSQLKAKGVNNAYVNLKNALIGANEQGDIKHAGLNKSLGSSEDYEKLYSYVSTQKMGLLIDIGLITSNRGSTGFSSADCMKSITGRLRTVTRENPFADLSKEKTNVYRVLKPSEIDGRVESLLRNFRNIPLSGYCVNDYADGFGIDYASGAVAGQTAQTVKNANASLATERTLAVRRGNFDSIRSARLIMGLPSETGYEQSAFYTAIPFVQMVLHGTADYTFEPINTAVNMKKALLRCVEYGALPSFEWFYRETGEEIIDAAYKYDNSINIAAEYYEKMSVLNSLRDCRIADHSLVKPGVYLSEYSDGSLVYVNYNENDVEVNDILIGAEDFVVIS